MFILIKIETSSILATTLMVLAVSSSPKANRRDPNIVSSRGHITRSNGCDEDCRRNMRRRKLIETKDYMTSVRNGELTDKEQNTHIMLDRLMSRKYENSAETYSFKLLFFCDYFNVNLIISYRFIN